MRRCGITLIGLLGTLVFCLDASAVSPGTSSNRFEGIPERNVFGLKSPAPGPEEAVQKAAPPKLILTGITTLLGNKLALMKALLPAKPGEPAKEQPLMLTEGQREGGVEVLEINEHVRSVKVNDYGTVMTLTFEKDGLKPPSSTPAVGAAGYRSAASAIPAPGATVTNVYPSPGGLTTRMRVLPTRMPRAPVTQEGAAGADVNSTSTGAVPVPSPTGRVSADTATSAPAEAQTQLTPDEQLFLQELQRAANSTGPGTAEPPAASTATPAGAGAYPYGVPPPASAPGVLPPGANMQRTTPPLMPQ